MNLKEWNSVHWREVENRVFRYQMRIYRASKIGNSKIVKNLQLRLINSLDAKLLAVRQVTTENKGKGTAGVDGRVYDTPESKLDLALKLKLDGKAAPIKRVEIPKPGKLNEKRPLGIPTVKDRAKQSLCRLALEPEWEAKFEANSYGFRPGRYCHDAIEAVYGALSNKRQQPDYHKCVMKVDIEKCFDKIDHDLLLEKMDTHPSIKEQVKAWLKAGILKDSNLSTDLKTLITNETGTPQGGVISPLLSNIALHGLLTHLNNWIITIPAKNNRKEAKQSALTVVRYADDIIVIHKDREVIEKAKIQIEKWLQTNCKLTLNQEKTCIIDSSQGFDFLGFTCITIKKNKVYRLKIYPSRIGQARILQDIREVIQRNKAASSHHLISLLKPKIIGWGNYYRYCECNETFTRITHYIHQKLRAWAFRVDKRHGRKIVKERYFPSGKTYIFENVAHHDNWILCGKKKTKNNETHENWLPHMSWITSKKWVKVKGNKSPFDGDHIYWAVRMISYKRLPKRVQKLLKLQNGTCTYCKHRFHMNSVMEVDHIKPKALGGKDSYNNLQLLHRDCHIKKTRTDIELVAKMRKEKESNIM
jgi:RNA-directed DNA polymerase